MKYINFVEEKNNNSSKSVDKFISYNYFKGNTKKQNFESI